MHGALGSDKSIKWDAVASAVSAALSPVVVDDRVTRFTPYDSPEAFLC